jgi:hypothetical protein
MNNNQEMGKDQKKVDEKGRVDNNLKERRGINCNS